MNVDDEVRHDPDVLWWDHNCHIHEGETCEGCGGLIQYRLARDWTRDWFLLCYSERHDGPGCEDCESVWVRHTPDRCRDVRHRDYHLAAKAEVGR